MKVWVSIAVLATGMVLIGSAFASDAGYIYGQVSTVDGDTYEGQLRWGSEEAFWDDIFNATKLENENLAYVDERQLDRRRHRHWRGWDWLFGDHDEDFTHVFAVRFGDLKRIRVESGRRLVVEFRNGEELRLGGGSNDVGARITVVDPKRGTHKIHWNRIRTVEFRDTPARLEKKLGEPIYGTVKTDRIDFTGFIQWDNDECLSIDKLDGETRDGDVSIEFGDIGSIRKHRRGVMVTLRSGEELYVTGSNDVNSDNRGVIVKVPGLGSAKIGWGDFEEVTFASPKGNPGSSYADYAKPVRLSGEVTARGRRYDGEIVFDLDEVWDFELLQGMNGHTDYLIPFREIARIEPQGRYGALVELRNGLKIELEDSQDVSRKNDGLLVFAGAGRPDYLPWDEVEEIRFR